MSQNSKTLSRIQIVGCVLDSGTCFGFREVFLDCGKCLGFWDLFWIPGSVFGFWDLFWIPGSVFGLWEVFCPYEPPYVSDNKALKPIDFRIYLINSSIAMVLSSRSMVQPCGK